MTAFSFHHAWVTAATRQRVYDAIRDVEHYPDWWPQVLAVAYVDDRTGRVLARSLAPFVLDLMLTSSVEDPAAGVLQVDLAGDLDGWCRFELADAGAGTSVDFTQQVTVTRPGLATAARLLGPVLRVNHAWMMRGCRRGLESQLNSAPA